MRRTLPAIVIAAALAVLGVPAAVCAQSAENVAVVINDASPDSQHVGEYYARKRGIPPANVVRIQAPVKDEITQAEFARTIEGPIGTALTRADLQDRILYIVLTKGVPLRITGTSGPTGTTASVDSELALLYRRFTGTLTTPAGPLPNPYFLANAAISAAKPFSHADYDIYLVTRLDGFTAEDAMQLVDRAAAPVREGKIVLDEKATLFNRTGEDWLDEAGKRLAAMGRTDVVVDRTAAPVRDVANALGYYSWGSNDPANRVRDFGVRFVPGALAATYVSSDARTFQAPPQAWQPTNDWNDRNGWFAGSPQTLTGDLIREGVTGVAGQVAEPTLGATVRPQILFPAYLSGFNLAESFYLAIPYLSWQTVVVGDPLCRPIASKGAAASALNPPVNPETGLPKYLSDRSISVARLQFHTATDAQAALAVRAQNRLAKADRAGAKSAYTELVKAVPNSVVGLLRLADLLTADRETDAAIARYREVLKIQPGNPLALNNLAYMLAVDKHSLAEARGLAEDALKVAPRDPNVNDTAGWIAYLSADYPRASRLLGQAVLMAPGNADVHLHAAFAFNASGARAAALTELNAAIKLAPDLEKRDDVQALRKQLGGGA